MPSLPNNPVPGTPVRADWGRRLLDYLRDFPLQSGPGIQISKTSNGWTISAKTASPQPKYQFPLQPIIYESNKIRFRYGTCRGIVPKIGGSSINADLDDEANPSITVSASGVIYVKVDIDEDSFAISNPVFVFVAGDESNIPEDVDRESAHHLLVGVVWDSDTSSLKPLAPVHTGSIDVVSCAGISNHWDLGSYEY